MSDRASIGTKLALLIVVATAVYLVGNDKVALWDRDEPRYAQTSRQMLQSGDWVVPRFLDELRTKKPPLIYWCQAACMKLLGDDGDTGAFAARLPSVAATVTVLTVLSVTCWRLMGPRRAWWTALIFASSGLTVAAAKMCLTDAVLLLWITFGQGCLFFLYRQAKGGPAAPAATIPLLWIAVALGVLTKGPIVLVVHLMTMIALAAFDVSSWRSWPAWRDAIAWWRSTKPLVGILALLVIDLPWLILVQRREPTFASEMFGNLGKHIGSSAEGHGAPPGYYLLTVWVTYFPWSLLLPLAIVSGVRHRKLAPIRFALAAVIGPWLFVEAMWSKLPHYLLPAFPALAILTADAMVRWIRGREDNFGWRGFVGVAGVWAWVAAMVGMVPWVAMRVTKDLPWVAMGAVTVAAIVYTVSVFHAFQSRKPALAATIMGAGMLMMVTVLYALYLPQASFLRMSPRVADILRADGATLPGQERMIDYLEPSLAFYQGGTIREARSKTLADPVDQWAKWTVTTVQAFDKYARDTADKVQILGRVPGINYADGRVEEVLVIRAR